MSFVGPTILTGSRAGQAIATQISRQPFVSSTSQQISNFFSNLFKGLPTKTTVTEITKKASIPKSTFSGVSKNVAITSGSILGTTAISSVFLSTPQGQNTLETANNALNLGAQVNSLFKENPLVPLGLLILGGLVVVSVIKK
jgi:hypothetical protein